MLALGIAQSKKVSLAEEAETPTPSAEILNETVEVEVEAVPESVMTELDSSNLKEVMNNKENKFIHIYRGDTRGASSNSKVEEHAMKMENGLKVIPYRIDIDIHFNLLASFLKERNPKTAEQVEGQIKGNAFLLANQYDDIWFWEMDLINYFYGDLLEQIFNFYQGPLKLISEEQLVMNQSGQNDLHFVAYIDDFRNSESIKKLKNFRKFNTKNTDKFFHLKFWVVEDK